MALKRHPSQNPQAAKDGSSLFVVREQMALRFSLARMSDEQKAVLIENKIKLWLDWTSCETMRP